MSVDLAIKSKLSSRTTPTAIELAIKKTLSSLTLGEKALADKLLASQQVYTGATSNADVWLRAPVIVLSDALGVARKLVVERQLGVDKALEAQKKRPSNDRVKLRQLMIFCDTLLINSGDIISYNATDVFTNIDVYAREIQAPIAADEPSLVVELGCEGHISFYTPKIPSTFEIIVSLMPAGSKTRQKPKVDEDKFGITYEYNEDSKSLDIRQEESSSSAFENLNYLDLINADGSVQDQGYQNDDLPRLLQFQTLIAQASVVDNKPLAIDLLDYVIAATALTESVHLNFQAIALRNSLSLGSSVSAVSSVNVYSSKQVLKSRLIAALAFDQAFRDFLLEARNASYQVSTSLNLLAKSNDALDTYKFMINVKQREYDVAVSSNEKAEGLFNKNNNEIAEKAKAFEAGAEKFKKDEEAKANKEIIKGILTLVVAVAATVATAGAVAPAAAGAAASAASTASKVKALYEKLKKIYDQLKKVYDKIKPILGRLKEIVQMSKDLIKSLENLKKLGDDARERGLKPGKFSGDSADIGLTEWEVFRLAVEDMQRDLDEYDIEGKKEYFMCMKTLVVRGSLFIKTQAAVVQKGDDLAIVTLQQKMESRDNERLSALGYKVSADEKVLELLKRAMFDRIMAVRTLVYHDFYTYHSAYCYHTLSKVPLITMSPVKPVVDYLDDAARLQGAVVAYGSRVLIQSRTFRTTSLCGFEDAGKLQESLTNTGRLQFVIDAQNPIWQGFSRIRMTGAKCFLDGAKGSDIRLEMSTDGRFFDRDFLNEISNPNCAFIGDPRTMLFEYNLATKEVNCDGRWREKDDYTKHTPITTWTVSIVGYDSSSTQIDLTGLTGVTMEFVCEVVWTGQ